VTGALAGRSALITGANQGLGLAIARAYVAEGASVFLCARSVALLDEAGAGLAAEAPAGQRVLWEPCDVADPGACDRVVRAALAAFPDLTILVNNAGVYGPMGPIEAVDWGAWVEAIQINLLGSVYMARALVPHFRARGYGKIVQLSGGGATSPLPKISAYAASKAGVVRFMETLAHELAGAGVDVNAIAPGALNTRLLDEVLAAGPDRVGEDFYRRSLEQKGSGGVALETGAALAVYLASAASDGVTGRLLSAVWDPWATLAQHIPELAASDIYTLRRIVPEDRGRRWGS
jgi:3-oxoacyl-[acyl-carrier protein] reductase